jgi:hypothetical protein
MFDFLLLVVWYILLAWHVLFQVLDSFGCPLIPFGISSNELLEQSHVDGKNLVRANRNLSLMVCTIVVVFFIRIRHVGARRSKSPFSFVSLSSLIPRASLVLLKLRAQENIEAFHSRKAKHESAPCFTDRRRPKALHRLLWKQSKQRETH